MVSYPGSLPPSSLQTGGLNHGQGWAEVYAALVELGVDPSGSLTTVKARLAALGASAKTAYIAGHYYASDTTAASGAVAQALDTGFPQASPFFLDQTRTFDRIAIWVTTAVAASVVRLAIYESDANFLPTNLILDAGTVSSATTGGKEITISQSLPGPGMYWLWADASLAGVQVAHGNTASRPPVVGRGSITDPSGFPALATTRAYAAAPSTFPAVGSYLYAAILPLVMLRST